MKQANLSEASILKQMLESNQVKQQKDLNKHQKDVSRFEKRVEEINILIKKIYEDRMHEKISEERFMIFLNDYEVEQKHIKESINNLRSQLT